MKKVALLGAGYIASHHFRALQRLPGVIISAVCDVNLKQAERLASLSKSTKAYSHLEEMLANESLDVVHILTPPDHHFKGAQVLLRKGCHLFIEKPLCSKTEECQILLNLATEHEKQVGVNHNFLFYPIFQKLKNDLENGNLGKPDTITITWHKNMHQLKMGPFSSWMLRECCNPFLETSPHLLSIAMVLTQNPEWDHVETSNPIQLPNGKSVWRRWNILGHAGNTFIQIRLALTHGFEEQSIEIRGQAGIAKVDFEKNTYDLQRHTPSMRPLDLFKINRRSLTNLKSQTRLNLLNWIMNKASLRKFGDPYFDSIQNSIRSFYAGLNNEVNPYQDLHFSAKLVQMACVLTKGKETLPFSPKTPPIHHELSEADILIIGATGFIGKELLKQLQAASSKVRVLVRDPEKIEHHESLRPIEIVKGCATDPEALELAMRGIKTVFHLATSKSKTWDEYLVGDIHATELIAECCIRNKVQKLIYTSTIDVYYAGNKEETITEKTPLDPKIDSRNLYAQAKAACERLLQKLQIEKSLPLVIIRPGIVLGNGSSPFHWGIGMWHYETVCELWGNGKSKLPLVLVEDVAKGLILAMEKKGTIGESFNLIDKPLLNAHEYLEELSQILGAKIEVIPTSIGSFFLWESLKWLSKLIIGQSTDKKPSYRDWANRKQCALYDCSKAKTQLNWNPQGNRDELLKKGIYEVAKTCWN